LALHSWLATDDVRKTTSFLFPSGELLAAEIRVGCFVCLDHQVTVPDLTSCNNT